MRKLHILLALVFLQTYQIQAQTIKLSGSIKDSSANLPVINAVVLMIHPNDSSIVSFTRTDKNGGFQLNIPTKNKLKILVTHPFFADYVEEVKINEKDIQLSPISLTSKSKLLETVIIRSGGAIKIKGDTTIYTADSFNVSANANVEELLKKLPGIQVDKNGEIKAMGEKVEKVLVDGEEFFGEDPGMAVKNLRADAVKEVQVFDKKSEQASFTGIDDGNTQKTINLKLKEDRKKGYFGKVAVSGGIGQDISNRFNNNLMFGSFKGKRKISAFVLNGNTGQDGLSWQESEKYGGSENSFEMFDEDGMFAYSFSSGNTEEDIYINTENGFTRNINAGIQYSNKWNDKYSINYTPKYNLQDYYNNKTIRTQTQLNDSAFNETSNINTHINRYNLKNTIISDIKIDSANSLKVTFRANYYHTESEETTDAETRGSTAQLKNSSIRSNAITSNKQAYSGNLIFKHKFKKERRTFSINTDWSDLNTQSDNYQISTNTAYFDGLPYSLSINQLNTNKKENGKLSAKAVYTEPLNKRWSMEVAYQITQNSGINNQTTFSAPIGSSNYTTPVDSLTNDFKQKITIHTPSSKFNYAYKKLKVNFGAGFGITNFDLLNRTTGIDYIRNYLNLFPNATFVYNYKGNHSVRVKYNGSTTQPTINQLQPLKNNTNIFNQFIGNPDLKPSFTNNFNITHNGYNFLKNQWFYQSLNVNITDNAITNSRIIDPTTGATVSQSVNTDGNINISFWSGFGFKTKKSEINLNINPNLNYNRFADIINNKKSFSNTYSGGISMYVGKSKTEKYDISINNNFNYNYNTNAQSLTANKFFSNDLTFSATVYYKKTWSIISDFNYYIRQQANGISDDIDYKIWNIQLQKTFNKNEFTVYVKARDILNQNIGIDRNYYGNTYTEEVNQRLKRYFMVGFSWDFKNKNNSEKK